MRWSEDDDGSLRAVDGDRTHVIRHIHIPYPPTARPGLKLLCGWFYQLETIEDDGQVYGRPRLFDDLVDAKRAVGGDD